MRMLFFSALVLVLAAEGVAQPPIPKGETPRVGYAAAVEKDGKVIVEVFELREVKRIRMPDSGDVFLEERHWSPLTTGSIGREIRAYRSDGKPADSRDVLKALAKPRAVTYFLGYDKSKPVEPDALYLGLLKEDSVALAFDLPELAPPPLP